MKITFLIRCKIEAHQQQIYIHIRYLSYSYLGIGSFIRSLVRSIASLFFFVSSESKVHHIRIGFQRLKVIIVVDELSIWGFVQHKSWYINLMQRRIVQLQQNTTIIDCFAWSSQRRQPRVGLDWWCVCVCWWWQWWWEKAYMHEVAFGVSAASLLSLRFSNATKNFTIILSRVVIVPLIAILFSSSSSALWRIWKWNYPP